mmetsp:Transcript_3832/g.3428  ORF Transcript_3832/g.3428 Transcript_3832/m.3428 type:complete len:125 (+) Transcript_3832:610-984(+)
MVTMNEKSQLTAVAMAAALPLTSLGKISDIMSHGIAPTPMEKKAKAGMTQKQRFNEAISGLRKYWIQVVIGVVLQICQQLSGINAVIFYQTTIFQAALPLTSLGKISDIMSHGIAPTPMEKKAI